MLKLPTVISTHITLADYSIANRDSEEQEYTKQGGNMNAVQSGTSHKA